MALDLTSDGPSEAKGQNVPPTPAAPTVAQVSEAARNMIKLAEVTNPTRIDISKFKEAEWQIISDWDFKKVEPWAYAYLLSKLPLGPNNTYYTVPQCLVLAREQYITGKDPLKGEIFVMPSGRIGTSLQGMLVDLKREGTKLSKPKFKKVERPWPKGQLLTRKEAGRAIDFAMEQEPGYSCTVKIDEEECEYTCWLIEWFMPSNPNWYNRMEWMLRVRSYMNCLKMGTGAGISEEIADETTPAKEERETKAPAVAPPSRFPTGR